MKQRFILIGLLLLAFALRVYRLDAQSIWWDEGISLHLATSSLSDIITDRAINEHPPLYFFLLKGWVALTGTSAFSTRFFSVLPSFLLVGVIFAVAKRWFGQSTAWLAAFLTTLSPLSLVYSQEIRVYALLPLVYLGLLLITREVTQSPGPKRRSWWLLLGVVEAVGLHLHYIVLFVVAYVGGWSLLTLSRGKRWAELRRWIIMQLLVGLASLPWLVTVLTHWSHVQARFQIGGGLTEPIPLDYLIRQVWTFYWTGLAGIGGREGIQLLAALTFLFLLLLVLLRLAHASTRFPTAWMGAHWLIPLSPALLVWSVRSFSHPRYIALFGVGLTLLAAYVTLPDSRGWRLGGRLPLRVRLSGVKVSLPTLALASTLAVSVLLLSILGTRAYFFDPTTAKDDVRGVAEYLETVAGPEDLILIPDSDWSLPFTYGGQTPIEMPRLADEEKMWSDLGRWIGQRPRVFAVGYPRGTRDQRGVVPFALEQAGTLIGRQDFNGIFVNQYQLHQPLGRPTLAPLTARFGPVTLAGSWVETEVSADSALTMALHWRQERSIGESYRLAIRLLDVDGWMLAAVDDLLLDERDRPTDRWSPTREVTTYHLLPLPSGLPPLTYTLALGLYTQTQTGPRPLDLLDDQGAPHGQRLELATVRLTPPLGAVDNPYRTSSSPPFLSHPVDLAGGLQLLGAALDRSTLFPGQSLFVTLRWRATQFPLPDLRPRLALKQGDQELTAVVSAPALGRYPTDQWQTAGPVLDHWRLVVPPTAPGGPASVILSLADQYLPLGEVEINAEEHLFTPPSITRSVDVRFAEPAGAQDGAGVARLIGYDLPDQGFLAGRPITLTLYWQALEGTIGTDLTVFTHILAADGHLIGQHDGTPVSGRRPTGGWLSGEIIIDSHVMTFREPNYVGPARIEVGLYDPATGVRLVDEQGRDFFFLPVELSIRPAAQD